MVPVVDDVHASLISPEPGLPVRLPARVLGTNLDADLDLRHASPSVGADHRDRRSMPFERMVAPKVIGDRSQVMGVRFWVIGDEASFPNTHHPSPNTRVGLDRVRASRYPRAVCGLLPTLVSAALTGAT